MKVYLPSWNGDFRLDGDGEQSELILHGPTDHERVLIGQFMFEAAKKGWIAGMPDKTPYHGNDRIAVKAPLSKASKLLIKIARPVKQTLTAVSFANGNLSVIEGAHSKALDEIEKTVAAAASEKTETSAKSQAKEKEKEKTPKPKEAAAASVKRPTPCCPSCLPGAIEPAKEVLLAFLSPEEHDSWAKKRAIVVTGGLTGHRYLLAHRHSALGQRIGRICYDIDDGGVIHFHDQSVPPEEEVLAAKLVLEHREHWLRNQSTCLGDFHDVFVNPFGHQYLDGTESANFASGIGEALLNLNTPTERDAILDHFTA